MKLRENMRKISYIFIIGLVVCIIGLISIPIMIPTPFGEPIELHLTLEQTILGWIFGILGMVCLLGFIISLRYEKVE